VDSEIKGRASTGIKVNIIIAKCVLPRALVYYLDNKEQFEELD